VVTSGECPLRLFPTARAFADSTQMQCPPAFQSMGPPNPLYNLLLIQLQCDFGAVTAKCYHLLVTHFSSFCLGAC